MANDPITNSPFSSLLLKRILYYSLAIAFCALVDGTLIWIYPDSVQPKVLLVAAANLLVLWLVSVILQATMFTSIVPLAKAIDNISHNEMVALPVKERDDLAYLKNALNTASQKLLDKNLARLEWTRGVSHDLRTPLTMIANLVESIESRGGNDPEIINYCSRIRLSCLRAIQLTRDLSIIPLIDTHSVPISREKIDINDLFDNAVESYMYTGLADSFSFDTQVPMDATGAPLELMGDSSLISRALTNLINNSIFSNPQGCAITLSARIARQQNQQYSFYVKSPTETIVISVSDNGRGMPPDRLDMLKHKLQYDNLLATSARTKDLKTTRDELNEHGFGLRVVQFIMRSHGGWMWLENAPGQGFTSNLVFPLHDYPPEHR